MQSKRTVGLPSRNARKGENKSISDIEWTTCWMAIRYAFNGQTIASSCLPGELIQAYYQRWTDYQKKAIARECERNEKDYPGKAFGNLNTDRPTWLKFWAACDIEKHYKIKVGKAELIVFKANERVYPLSTYIKDPWVEIYINNNEEICTNILP